MGASLLLSVESQGGGFAVDTLIEVLSQAVFPWVFWGISWTSLYSWLVLPVNIQQVAFSPKDKGTFFGTIPCSVTESFVGVIILLRLPIIDPYCNSRAQSACFMLLGNVDSCGHSVSSSPSFSVSSKEVCPLKLRLYQVQE